MKYEIKINRDECLVCGSCYSTDPKQFEAGEDGRSQVVGGSTNGTSVGIFNDNRIEDVKIAAGGCPVSTIRISET
ncbi:ferredoxin [[Eubacterium] cellulosolvens]